MSSYGAAPLSARRNRASGLFDWPEIRAALVRLVPGAIVVWLIVCGVGLLFAHPLTSAGFTHWEGGVDRFFAARRSPGWNSVTNVFSLIGDTPAVIGLSTLAFFVLRPLTGRWRESMAVAAAMLGEVAIFSSTTIVVGRKRPAVPHLDGSPPTSSFPSGHTAASTTLYGLLAIIVFGYTARVVVRALAVAVAVVIPVAIGISRLYRGMHFPSDVGGGILLGVLWFTVVGFVVLRGRFPADHHGRAEVREPAPGSVQR